MTEDRFEMTGLVLMAACLFIGVLTALGATVIMIETYGPFVVAGLWMAITAVGSVISLHLSSTYELPFIGNGEEARF